MNWQDWLADNQHRVISDTGTDVDAPARRQLREVANSERVEQEYLFAWIRQMQKQDERYGYIFHIPNGGHRHPAVGERMRRQGVRRGVFDILGLVPSGDGKYSGFAIELKRSTGTIHLRPEQKAWLKQAERCGMLCEVAYGATQARRFIEAYMARKES